MTETTTFEEQLESCGSFTYKSKGTSMLPLLRENRDLFTVTKKTGRCKKLDVALFKRARGDYVLHRVVKVLPEGYLFRGDNQITKERVREEQVLGIMTSVIRSGKTVKCTDATYLCYSRLWHAIFFLRYALTKMRGLLSKLKHKLIGS